MKKAALFFLLFLGIVGLYLEQQSVRLGDYKWIIQVIDYTLVLVLLSEGVSSFLKSPRKSVYLKTHIPSLIFLFVYLTLFIINRVPGLFFGDTTIKGYFFLIIIRNILLVLKVYGRIRKLTGYLNSIFSHPAQTVVLSFVIVIMVGTLLLMMPMMSTGDPLKPVDAFFTITSAVCVTGLIVVDTATQFTIPGQITIMVMIQIGGLGIMLLSYFMMFAFRRSVSLKDRQLLSYMLNASDMKSIINSVKRIIFLTFSIELAGAVLMFPIFLRSGLNLEKAIFFALFHGVSAFCNAGFALYSDSLVSFKSNIPINLIISGLIIAGGISFTVMTDVSKVIGDFLRKKRTRLTINSRVVLLATAILLLFPMLIFYRLEHDRNLYTMGLGTQYLSAFFQSVTLRTAGFNTVPFETLGAGTLMMMIGVMFIGGASGSTAGGIKVNTLGVTWAYIRSFRRGSQDILLYRHQVPKDQVMQAFTVILFGMTSIFLVTFLMFLTESAEPVQILFEAVSAFATVGLSTGITGGLTLFGKLAISALMFIGRIGPLTLLTASAGKEKSSAISYPEATLLIG